MSNEEIGRLMDEYGLDFDDAERVVELMEDDGFDEETAVELVESGEA